MLAKTIQLIILWGTIQIMDIVSLFLSKSVGQQGAKLIIKELVSYVPN
jgi:hypothetical protein